MQRAAWVALLGLLLAMPARAQSASDDALDALFDAPPSSQDDDADETPASVAVVPLRAEEVPSAIAPAARRAAIEEIVVTAQKREQNLQDIPISVSALGAADIKERQVSSLADVAAQIAGFQFGEVAGGGQASIRGVGFSLVSGAGEGSVAIHTDGLFLSRPGASTMLQDDIAGIEVLRGPQGTLYGRNATAGVINFITPAPPQELSFGASAQAANFDARKYSGHVGGGVFDGALRLRISGSVSERDDHLVNEAFPGRDQGGLDAAGLRAAIDLDLGERLRFSLRAFDATEDFNGPLYAAYKPDPEALLAPPGTYSDHPYRIRTNDAGVSTKKLRGGSFKGVAEFGERFTLSAISGYVDYGFDTRGYDGDGTSNDLFTATRLDTSETFTQELILSYESERWQWLVGGYYMSEDYTLNNDILVSAAGAVQLGVNRVLPGLPQATLDELLRLLGLGIELVNIENDSVETTSSRAVFADTTYALSERLRVFLGARYLEDEKTQLLTSRIVVNGTENLGLVSCEELRSEFRAHSTTGRIGLQFDVRDDFMTYAQFSSGYKTGGFAIGACNEGFEPEELDAWELGFKSTWLERRLRLNAAAFHYDYTNLQVEQVVLPTVIVNNAQARVHGAELELTALPAPAWELSFNATLLDARYTEFVNADNTEAVIGAQDQDLSGNYLNRSPKFAGGLALQYRETLDRFGALSLRAEARHTSRTWLREFNNETDFQKAVTLYDAYASWSSPRDVWTLRAFGKNLSDKPVLAGFLGVAGYKTATFQLPRTYGLEIGYSFR
jgi:iron complex outermembrane recepter protein